MSDHVVTKPKKISALVWLLVIVAGVLIIAAISTPNLLRSRMAADQSYRAGMQRMVAESKAAPYAPDMADARQVIRTVEMALIVDDPARRLDEVTAIATRLGGFVENSQAWRGDPNSGGSAQATLRVPADRLDEARAAIRGMAKKVEQEKLNASDVTSQMVDTEATLRNYRAEEQQYLGIMARAGSVRDTLEVAQRLSEVRGRIERTQAQWKVLQRQVSLATITVSLRPESMLQSVQWLPDVKQAWRDAAESTASYLATMTALLLHAPVVLAWFFSLAALLALAWRMLRWIWTRWFMQGAGIRA